MAHSDHVFAARAGNFAKSQLRLRSLLLVLIVRPWLHVAHFAQLRLTCTSQWQWRFTLRWLLHKSIAALNQIRRNALLA
ncbi:hypothetical protein BCV70DRAFT_200022 [Testicularia cyperi]|uniref:Uncharacterized protein n=1 Tax=Testicularia cyperi TaxID=1882483 RepID=A0A317XTT3_9BASI|nr:hypothetical protein BCV70DRAFT_200022 [Testicularia cyperi]